jgi:lipopolysaccharide/colanic/teichoic acid biosynthesis glycosyltransferase
VRSRLVKRALDVTGAAVALAVGAPVIAGVAALVWYDVGRPVLFRQRRPGRDGVPFDFVKFRTMRDAVDKAGRPLPDAERLTKIGAWLRATSLDELPELWTVLRGEMSLVGPRPLLMKYLDRYTAEQRRRHEVKPGITGWAQVNGRNAADWDTKLARDIWYVDHWSLWLDLRILVRTVGAVLRRDGITHAGAATMPEFMGAERGQPGRGV